MLRLLKCITIVVTITTVCFSNTETSINDTIYTIIEPTSSSVQIIEETPIETTSIIVEEEKQTKEQLVMKDDADPKQPTSQNESISGSSSASNDTTAQKDTATTKEKANYVGVFKIPSQKLSVKCYAGWEQSIVDRKNSAAYFYGYEHQIIADHKNQGFDKIKKCKEGTIATFTVDGEVRKFKCVAKINGHNTETDLTDNNYKSISRLYPGTMVCYTCNDNWKNITLVFFERVYDEPKEEAKDTNQKDDGLWGCDDDDHIWGKWEIAWERMSNGAYYGWDFRTCKVCEEEEWTARAQPSDEFRFE